jgi:hypothetical protein
VTTCYYLASNISIYANASVIYAILFVWVSYTTYIHCDRYAAPRNILLTSAARLIGNTWSNASNRTKLNWVLNGIPSNSFRINSHLFTIVQTYIAETNRFSHFSLQNCVPLYVCSCLCVCLVLLNSCIYLLYIYARLYICVTCVSYIFVCACVNVWKIHNS